MNRALLFIVAFSPFLGLGYGVDFHIYGHKPESVWLPAYGLWILAPFVAMPFWAGLISWNLVNAGGLSLLASKFQANLWLVSLSFPVIYLFGNGQIGGVIAGGLALALSQNPLLAGLGLIIASIKPQIAALPIIAILLARRDIRLLIVPALVLVASILIHGPWPLDWFLALFDDGPGLSQTGWNIGLWFPVSLLALFFIRDFRSALLLSPVISPYYAFYSLAVPSTVFKSKWSFAAVWAVALVYVSGYTSALMALPLVLIGELRCVES